MSTIVIQQRRSDRTTSAIITTVLHVLLGILFLFIGMKQFDPPIPEQMVELVMEDSGGDAGGGASQPETGGQPTTAEESGEPEDVATDEESDVEVIKPPAPKPVTKPVPKPVVKQPKKDTRLEDALNNWNTPSENPSQNPSDNPSNNPSNSNGSGIFRGSGWELRGPGGAGGSGGGRGLARGPDLSERPPLQNPTWVEVKVIVDQQGEVVRVSIANTGTPDVAIQNVALRAAKTCRFVALPNGPPEQAHYIKLRFVPG
ncbi:MAG: TonB family protein [Flavobacteriales bacterium]|nr:TonB family protein [Flavobacteriales bacterium]